MVSECLRQVWSLLLSKFECWLYSQCNDHQRAFVKDRGAQKFGEGHVCKVAKTTPIDFQGLGRRQNRSCRMS